MTHQECLSRKCRLCGLETELGNERADERKLSVTNVWIHEFLNAHYDNVPLFSEEEGTKFPKWICHTCYYKCYRHKTAVTNHTMKQKKLPKARRSELDYSGAKITFPSEQDFKHGDDGECKVCGTENTDEERVESPHGVEASPGKYKRKETSPFETPKTKRTNIRKPGTARPTILLNKIEAMEVDEDDPEIVLNKVSEIGTKISSERETVKEENIKDKSVAQLFKCTICEKVPRQIVKLDTCNHMFCRTCIYEWKSQSRVHRMGARKGGV
jgi:hypothetical protein